MKNTSSAINPEQLKAKTIEALEKLSKYKVISDFYIEKKLLPAIKSLDFSCSKDIELAIEHLSAQSTLPGASNLPVIVQRQMERYDRHNTDYMDQNYYRELKKTCTEFLNIVAILKVAAVPELIDKQVDSENTARFDCAIS